jgi:hypothetical protein
LKIDSTVRTEACHVLMENQAWLVAEGRDRDETERPFFLLASAYETSNVRPADGEWMNG